MAHRPKPTRHLPASLVTVIEEPLIPTVELTPQAKASTLKWGVRQITDLVAYTKAGQTPPAFKIFQDTFDDLPEWLLPKPELPDTSAVTWFAEAKQIAHRALAGEHDVRRRRVEPD